MEGKTIMWAWIIRLVSGWIPISGEKLGKIIWVVGIIAACFFVYQKFMQPTSNTRTNQRADAIENITNNNAPRAGFGCASLRVIQYLGEKKIHEGGSQ